VVAVDHFTKWVEARALHDATAQSIVPFIYEEIICRHGVPEVLLWHPRSNTADFEPSDDSDGTLTSEEEIDLPYQAARLYELPENTHTNLCTKAHHLSHPLFLAHGTEANPLK
jgi:hypothetical protein